VETLAPRSSGHPEGSFSKCVVLGDAGGIAYQAGRE
jgi:hypothetical protein